MSKIKGIILFSLGAAAGTFATWQYFKTKYEQIAQEEIDSVKEYFSKFRKSEDKDETESSAERKNEERGRIVCENGYTNRSNERENAEPPKDASGDSFGEPFVISPDEFGDLGYDTFSLTYYADGILADDADDVIDNADEIIGPDSLNHFGEYEEDSVHVRNDRLQCDYEILLDQGSYQDRLKPQQG